MGQMAAPQPLPTLPLEILLVDDEPGLRARVGEALSDAGHTVTMASDGAEAMELTSRRDFDLVVTDVRPPKVDGFAILRALRADSPGTDVILITAYGTVSDAVTALKESAIDYVTKPFEPQTLVRIVAGLAERRILRAELERARARLTAVDPHTIVVGGSRAMMRLFERIDAIADSDAAVLVTGESGTGKEIVARMIHDRSVRRGRPFVAVNCAAFPQSLLEAELFGHEKGSFTGAVRSRVGRFKSADGGTLFLDEIGEIPLEAQPKLLRVLQDGAFEPIGTNTTVQVDVRVISATNRDLRARIAEGMFRDDLLYRLRVVELQVPPLRERSGDLPLLVEHFLRKYGRPGEDPPALSPQAWTALRRHPFPGNVRELQHAIEHACVLSRRGDIRIDHLPDEIRGTGDDSPATDGIRSLVLALRDFEREYLLRALELAGGERQRAADLLGITRKSLWERLRRYGLGRRRSAAARARTPGSRAPAAPALRGPRR